MEPTTNKEIIEKVKEYAYKNYSKRFGNKELIVEEGDNVFYVKSNKDQSPLILGKGIV